MSINFFCIQQHQPVHHLQFKMRSFCVCGVYTCAQAGPVCCVVEGSPLLQKHWGGAGRCVEEPGSGWGWRWQSRGWMWPLPAASRPVGTGWLEFAVYWEKGLRTGRAGIQSGITESCQTVFIDYMLSSVKSVSGYQ